MGCRTSGARSPAYGTQPFRAGLFFGAGPLGLDGKHRFPIVHPSDRVAGRVRGIPHLAENERDVGHPIICCQYWKPSWILQVAIASRLLGMTKERASAPKHEARLKILDVLLDIEYKPSIEGWSWCASGLRSLYSFRFPMLPRAT